MQMAQYKFDIIIFFLLFYYISFCF